MSMFSRSGDAPSFGLPSLSVAVAAVGAIGRTIAHRRAALRVAELPDYLLTDIGIKRDDVHEALSSDWHDDPTYRLAVKAAEHRQGR
ncbi:DUF1127 domain-containing protein [Aureimonas leprariae]|uniref:DUF1127 domain-containing protein n=1 Tax=Plantimonas leprariae TaxID=2615207 RepID=A0A7V7PKE3_9HYPH|nr:DUF1127 domain-containing protein [Aureimonas leprariae]KAB0675812.1 DUF1127 domain-containing protein [Aureimonas leprariae]